MALELTFFYQIGYFLIFALLAGLISMRFRQPPVIGFLIAGAIIGPNVLGIIDSPDLVELFFQVGAIFILFEIGVEFSMTKLLSSGFKAVSVALLKITALFAFGHQIGVFLSLDFLSSVYLGLIFSISSTAILIKLAEQKGTSGREEMHFLFTMLIIEDIFAVAALTFLSSLSTSAITNVEDTIFSIFLSLFILGFSYHVLRRVLVRASSLLVKYKTEDTAIFLALALCTLFSLFAYWLGLSPTIGAFVAGDLMSMLPICSKLERPLKPFILTFTGLFFLSVGMMINPASIIANLQQEFIIVSLFVLASFSIVSLLTYLSGFSSRSAIFAGSSMVVLGEFSLLLAREASIHAPAFDFIGTTSLAVLATAIFSSFALDRQASILTLLHDRSPSYLRANIRKVSTYFGEVIADFEPGGKFFSLLLMRTKAILRHAFYLVAIAGVSYILTIPLRGFYFDIAGMHLRLSLPVIILASLLILFELLRIALQLAAIVGALSKSVVRFSREGESFSKSLFRDVLLLFLSLFAAISIPAIAELLQMPEIFHLASLPFLAFAFLLVWDMLARAPSKLHHVLKGRG